METKQFAWWPITVTSGKRIWLKYYFQHKALYDESTGRPPIGSLYFTWTETEQEKTWRLLKESVVHNRNVWNEHLLTHEDISNLYEK
jgi:hypothetical protein